MRWLLVALWGIWIAGCGSYQRPRLDASPEDGWFFGAEPSPEVGEDGVVFAAIGDVGKGNVPQAVVADGVARACAGRCDFAVLLGDNLYEWGITEPRDEAALACMVDRYDMPRTYLVLGNHDYDPLEPTVERARRELAWIRQSDGSAAGGHHFYRFRAGPVNLVALDTNLLVRGRFDEAAYRRLAGWLGPLRPREGEWVLVVGHHPYASNGSHQSAGGYLDAGLSLWPGRFFRHFMEHHVLGRAHVYFAGHDHNLQLLPRAGGTTTAQVVSGAGSKCDPPPAARPLDAAFEHYGYGFVIVEATAERLTLTFHDAWGAPLYTTSRGHRGGWHLDAVGSSANATSHCNADLSAMLREPPRVCRAP